MYFLVEKLRHLVGVYGTSQLKRCGLYHSVFTNVHQLLVEIGTDTWLERISSWQNTTTTWLKVCDYLTLKTLSTKQHTILKNILGRSTTTTKKNYSVLWSDQTFLFKVFDRTGSIRTHSLDDILLNPPPHRQLLQLHSGPSWRSFSWHGLGVHHRMETSGRSRCASDCPGEPQRRGCSPPACAHCKDR